MNTISYANIGVQRGVNQLRKHANEVVQNADPEAKGNLEKPVIGLKEAQHQTAAAAKALKAESQMIGYLFDQFA